MKPKHFLNAKLKELRKEIAQARKDNLRGLERYLKQQEQAVLTELRNRPRFGIPRPIEVKMWSYINKDYKV